MRIEQKKIAHEVKVSIIVPVYKSEKYLRECVDSILNQSLKDIEVMLVDDGSPDHCPQICDEYMRKDPRVTVIHKENGGASSARNVGIIRATGRYIGFVDSDDWIEPEMYETLLNCIESTNADMAVCDIAQTKGGRKTGKPEVEVWSNSQALGKFFRVDGNGGFNSVCRRLVKKDLFKGWNFIEGKMNEDIQASYYLTFKAEKTVYVKKEMYHYRKNTEGVTNSGFSKKKLDLLDIWDIVQKQVLQYTPEYAYACEMNCKRARFTLLTQMYMNGYDHNDPYMREIKQRLKKEVRASFFDLMRWKMPINRKIALIAFLFVP